ncbi:MAG: T9SS type A sorting domain-containing protein [Bacteroidota bacterium]
MTLFSILKKVTLCLMAISYPLLFFGQEDHLLLNQVIQIQEVEREYHLFLPDLTEDPPVVILVHGFGDNFNDVIGIDSSGLALEEGAFPYRVWLDIAEEENIILVIPNGTPVGGQLGWNDCRGGDIGNPEEDDLAFIASLLDLVLTTYNADRNRVYATGASNGGQMCIRLAQEIPEKIAAIASISASNAANSECAESAIPIPALFINGTEDPLLPYEGGQMVGGRGEVFSVEQTVAYWVQRNSADSIPEVMSIEDINVNDGCTATKFSYKNQDNETVVVLFEMLNGGHASPSIIHRYGFPLVPFGLGNQNGDIEMAPEVWDFFKDKLNVGLSSSTTLLGPASGQVNVYPNPARDIIMIDVEGLTSTLTAASLFNSSGQLVKRYENLSQPLHVPEIPSGMYFLRMESKEGVMFQKMLKE